MKVFMALTAIFDLILINCFNVLKSWASPEFEVWTNLNFPINAYATDHQFQSLKNISFKIYQIINKSKISTKKKHQNIHQNKSSTLFQSCSTNGVSRKRHQKYPLSWSRTRWILWLNSTFTTSNASITRTSHDKQRKFRIRKGKNKKKTEVKDWKQKKWNE